MLAYNEKSGVEFEAAFFDANGNPTQPDSVVWRLDCETSATLLRDYTPASVIAETAADGQVRFCAHIEVPGPLNAIQREKNTQELKKLIVIANKDADSEFSAEYRYVVRNLRGRS